MYMIEEEKIEAKYKKGGDDMLEPFNWDLSLFAVFVIFAYPQENIWIKIGIIAVGFVVSYLAFLLRKKQMEKRYEEKMKNNEIKNKNS